MIAVKTEAEAKAAWASLFKTCTFKRTMIMVDEDAFFVKTRAKVMKEIESILWQYAESTVFINSEGSVTINITNSK